MKLTLINNRWMDENNNRAHYQTTKEEAIKQLSTLKNCINCDDCWKCANCTNCVDCTECTNCINCWHCKDCEGYVDCWHCIGCIDSKQYKVLKEQKFDIPERLQNEKEQIIRCLEEHIRKGFEESSIKNQLNGWRL